MKKNIIIFLIILISLFAVLFLLGLKGEYAAERALWHINKDFQELLKDPEAVPDASFENIAQRYSKFVTKHPTSQLRSTAQLLIGRVYVQEKKYDKARDVLESIIVDYPEDPNIGLRALSDIGKIYAIEGDEENEIKTYQRVTELYPQSYLGLRAPFLIGKKYLDQDQPEKAEEALKRALKIYDMMIAQYPNSAAEFDAMRMKAACFLAMGKPRQAVDLYADVLFRSAETTYLNMPIAVSLFRLINSISIVELHDFEIPKNIYKKFLQKYPQHPLNNVMEQIIVGIDALERKSQENRAEETK